MLSVRVKGYIVCHWKRVCYLSGKGVYSLSKEKLMLYIREKGYIVCHKKRVCYLSGERGILSVIGKVYAIC